MPILPGELQLPEVPRTTLQSGCKSGLVSIPRHLVALGETLFGLRYADFAKSLTFDYGNPHGAIIPGMEMCIASVRTDATAVMHLANGRRRVSHEFKHRDVYGMKAHLNANTTDLIVDIGSNTGEFTLTASRMAPRAMIITVEPAPTTYWLMRLNLWLNGVVARSAEAWDGRLAAGIQHVGRGTRHSVSRGESNGKDRRLHGVFPLLAAVGYEKGSTNISYSTSRSMYAVTGTNVSVSGWLRQEVPQFGLTDLIDDHRVAMLKMDCEGCEFPAIAGAPGLFADKSRVRAFAAEWHLSLLNPSTYTYGVKPSPHVKSIALEAFRARGCPQGKWNVIC